MTHEEAEASPRSLHEIAAEIIGDWRRPYFGAVPYLESMLKLDGIDDDYFGDGVAEETVMYFLENAKTWRGGTARRVKAELREMIS